jgi:excisionase family DNA binding protein
MLRRAEIPQAEGAPMRYERRALRPKDAATAYGISRSLLYEWMKAGRLASVRIGGARLIPVDALEAIISGAK